MIQRILRWMIDDCLLRFYNAKLLTVEPTVFSQ